jgi:hypothetical protein
VASGVGCGRRLVDRLGEKARGGVSGGGCNHGTQGVTKRCRLSWMTNSALVYEPKGRGRGGVWRGLS